MKPQSSLSGAKVAAVLLGSLLLAPLTTLHAGVALPAPGRTAGHVNLEAEFRDPSGGSRVAVFWFWANTVTKEGIRRDLEEMQRAGIGRVILSMTRAHSATVETGGVVFLTPEWLALFRYALDEAERLGIKVSAVMSNGWYQGAPWVTPEMGAQMLAWSETAITGPAAFAKALPEPDKFRKGRHAGISKKAKGHFKPIAVLAFRQNEKNELLPDSLVRLDDKLQPDGKLDWSAPAGTWRVFRFAYCPNFVPMKQDSPGFTGLQIDHLSAPMMEKFFNQVGVPMLQAAGPHVGKTLDYLHEDSVELGNFDWTGDFPAQFAKRRNYDLIPWLPVLAGKKFAGQPQASRIETDFVATVDEVFADEHYGKFRELCHQHGIKLQTEGGDVHSSLRVKGTTDLVMGEFWNGRPKKSDSRYVEGSDYLRAFNPNAVIAAHVYGTGRVSFEAFTTGQHWMEHPAMLKPMADEVFCLGVNHLTLHGYSYSRPETPAPGDVYFAGTHFNSGNNWWPYTGGFFTYLNRCQAMLNAGRPVVDILYVDGAETQAMIQQNESRFLTTLGKCDVIPGDFLNAQLQVLPGGRVGLANGASYPVLAIANTNIAPDVLQKIVRLVNAGATLWLRKVPQQSPGWKDCAAADQTIARCLQELGANQPAGVHAVGKGRVITGDMPVKDILARLGLAPAFAYTSDSGQPCLDYIQRQDGDADIYFVANWKDAWHRAECALRVTDKQPELWNPLTGEISSCPQYQVGKDTVRVPLQLPPNGSTFVVFRKKAEGHREPLAKNPAPAGATGTTVATLAGPWRIQFNPARAGLAKFETNTPALFLWNESADARLKTFAGSASYLTVFNAKPETKNSKVILDLGAVHDLAEVFVNGKSAGVVWTAPFRVDVTKLLQPGTNALEIRVVNTWHNWRVANKFSPVEHSWAGRGLKEPPLPAGLVGPVTLRAALESQMR
ncbi:MAG: glycosyl hydrolase [Limisphaerales bacterium]